MQRIKTLWNSSGVVGKIMILAGSLVTFCCSCLGIFSFMQSIGVIPTSTPIPTLELAALQSTADAITFQSFTQTALALPTLAEPTATVASIFDLIPSATIVPATLVSIPTATAIPTFTNVPPLNAPTLSVIIPTNPPAAGGVCSCSGDTLNCGDFSSYSSANACFDYCISVGAGDIHRLDGNNDGSACDSLR